MRTTDLFKSNRAADKINESLEKAFGKKLNLEAFDLPKLEDARNKLRTQLSQVRSESGFNENLENDAYHQAQWMLDAINSEIAERQEFVADPHQATVEEGGMDELAAELGKIANEEDYDKLYDLLSDDGPIGKYLQDQIDDITAETGLHPKDDFEKIEQRLMDRIQDEFADYGSGYDGDREDPNGYDDEGGETDDAYALASAGHGSDEDYGDFPESAPPTAKGERMVKHIKKGYADDGKLTDKERSIAYATAWKQHNKDKNEDMNTTEAYINNAKDAVNLLADLRKQSKMAELGQGEPVRPNQLVNDLWDVMQWIEHNMKESIETESVENSGEDMTKLHEGEIQQASAIVTAKTMVDRVGRWIEELSGMENDTLLTLGDSIRDEMGQEKAKAFISAVAPTIQQALENLKQTRETLSTGVRALTGEEQSAEMLGGEPGAEGGDLEGPAEPDALNPEGGLDDLGAAPEDEFAAAEPAAGGMNDAGREKRESINFENRLLKVLAG
jgi:hypothetical protein